MSQSESVGNANKETAFQEYQSDQQPCSLQEKVSSEQHNQIILTGIKQPIVIAKTNQMKDGK